MESLLIIASLIIIIGIFTYPKWSISKCAKLGEINSKHPDWYPNCGIDFLDKDPQWFVVHGYGKYVKKKRNK